MGIIGLVDAVVNAGQLRMKPTLLMCSEYSRKQFRELISYLTRNAVVSLATQCMLHFRVAGYGTRIKTGGQFRVVRSGESLVGY